MVEADAQGLREYFTGGQFRFLYSEIQGMREIKVK